MNQQNTALVSLVSRAILHTLPTAVLALDSNDTVIFSNTAAQKLLQTPKENLEGGSLSRFIDSKDKLSTSISTITFSSPHGELKLNAVAKELVVDDLSLRVVLLKSQSTRDEAKLAKIVSQLSSSTSNHFDFVCQALVDLGITKNVCVRSTTSTVCEYLASSNESVDIFSTKPTVSRTISKDDFTHVEILIVPDSTNGLTEDDLNIIDMFISLLHLKVDTQENASDASGSETALALALKAGDMGMCFFDTKSQDAYLSDRLATWCGINPENFDGSIKTWLNSFEKEDASRISKLFSELEEHKKFKTVVNIHTLEQDIRLELVGRPLHENSSTEWVAIARQYRDEQEVEAAWQTRIAMEESARIEAEESLEKFEKTLTDTLLPTTSDVTIIQSRQAAGTWHIARPVDPYTYVFAVGSVTASNRTSAIVDATITTTIADVLALQTKDIETFIEQLRDHVRARDIETTIAGVRVVGANVSAATHAGASVFISGKPFSGKQTIESTTAIALSSHSQATPETVEVAANGRPWKIMTTVTEVISIIETKETVPDTNTEKSSPVNIEVQDPFSFNKEIEYELEEDSEDIGKITGHDLTEESESKPANVAHIRSGSINPNS